MSRRRLARWRRGWCEVPLAVQPDRSDVKDALRHAVLKLIQNDSVLLSIGVGEPTVSARLMHYLVTQFPGWDVDAEYNKNGRDPKRAILPDGLDAKIKPDVIVHRRESAENLLAIEVKKSRRGNHRHDIAKLEACTRSDGLAYRFGAHVILKPPTVQWFENGEPVGDPERFAP